MPFIGDRRIIGQTISRQKLMKIWEGDRINHAYLFSGPGGVGKKALALAFAEMLMGIDHLTDMSEHKKSQKSSWFAHPDIRLFLPIPSKVSMSELRSRIELLSKDPYDIVDFSLRPSLDGGESSKNRLARYNISYFREDIKPIAYLKPNEGDYNIILLSNIEKMGKEANNAFLKLLEEPPPRVIFLMTTDNIDALLPTIISRCQVIGCTPLKDSEIKQGLMDFDDMPDQEAEFLSKIAGGNYSTTRFYDLNTLRESRQEVVNFLRFAYTQDANKIIEVANSWNSNYNTEGLLGIFNMLEAFIRDLIIYRSTKNPELITNSDQLDVISKFCESLAHARLDEMLEISDEFRILLLQNVNSKYLITVMALRFSYLIRGHNPVISSEEAWKHIPATVFSDV